MEQQKQKRLVLTSVNQVIMLTRNNPAIVDKLPKLSRIIQMPLSTTPKKGCNCGGKQNIVTPDANKQITEAILSSLDNSDFKEIKNVLGLDELCYYKRTEGSLDLICV